MYIGVIGAGRMGEGHAKVAATLEGVSGVLIADQDAARARHIAQAVGGRVADTAALVSGDADALIIAAPTPLHASLIERACEAGIPVLCEKPVADDLARARDVVTAVEGSGVHVQIGFQRRYDNGFRAARNALHDGDVGELLLVRGGTHDPAPPPIAYLRDSGGVFNDMLIHDFDALRYVTGEEAVSVHVTGAALVDDEIGRMGDADTVIVTLRLASGALAVLTGCRLDPRGYDVRMELFGTRDSIAVGVDARVPLRSVDAGGLLQRTEPGWDFFLDRFADAYRAELEAFVAAVAAGTGPDEDACTARDALEAMVIAEAARRSFTSGSEVSVDAVRSEVCAV
jgi:myo-inositol 2-dehydrogenase/D-chiro-inositol 1-dehydrogenase